ETNSFPAQLLASPASEAVTQFTLGNAVLSICLFARTAGVRKQPFITASWIFSGHLPAEIKKFSGFSQPFAGEANWMTSSEAGAYRSAARTLHRLASRCNCLMRGTSGRMDPGFSHGNGPLV